MVHVPKEHCLKWDKKSAEYILVGYGEDVMGYRLYNPVKKNIVTNRDVIFMEEEL
ncbi:Retrovirus-related Pol polyprotein from transposon TNT 1-94, partial [Eumeta japonica]